jgi:hypothetical protein
MTLEKAVRKFTQEVADHIQQQNPNIVVEGGDWEIVAISADLRGLECYVQVTLTTQNEELWLPFLKENKEKFVSQLFEVGRSEIILFFSNQLKVNLLL